MQETAAGVNDVGDIAFAFVFIWRDQRFAHPANHFGGVLAVEQKRPNAIFPHGPDAVTEHEPTRLGFDWRTAVAELNKLPGELGLQKQLRCAPEMQMVRK